MGNVHVKSHRVGWSAVKDGPITFLNEPAVFEAHDGVEPRRLCAEFTLDHKIKLEHVTLKWIAHDCAAVPPDTQIIEVGIPVAMETISSSCTLPRPWPPGAYRIDAYVGKELAGSVEFTVRGDPAKSKWGATLSYKMTEDANAAVPFADQVTKDARVFHVIQSEQQNGCLVVLFGW